MLHTVYTAYNCVYTSLLHVYAKAVHEAKASQGKTSLVKRLFKIITYKLSIDGFRNPVLRVPIFITAYLFATYLPIKPLYRHNAKSLTSCSTGSPRELALPPPILLG